MKRAFQIETEQGLVSGFVGLTENTSPHTKPVLVAIHGGTYTSQYFDVPGYSLIDRAIAAGFQIVALDRPGYGTTDALADGSEMLDRNAHHISKLMPEILSQLGLSGKGIILIGHSMGGVIATTIAANQPDWPLLGIICTGFAQNLPMHLAEGFAALPEQYFIELPVDMKDQLMFGPTETLAKTMPRASHLANTHMPRAEAIDIASDWAIRAPSILGKVTVPVYYKLAEFEQLWQVADQPTVADMYTNTPRLETGVFKGAGHCIDFHECGARFHDEILSFAASL
ncbi:alpha/beta hydrolase [Sulfitobacter pseudonitzschiae]|uniref:Alpha/beta hydrolase n=1 Tax=Pseudosulfitobacter pseudonitzschiae TaxID=1402135 RepID=A0A9Q2RXK3_9RHOB|nr:alpha/beta hydrolase [Pseudosulfitobacter pseudonitzschiae]MBM2294499.1 alpha/beta hydrolase [Pseudosulfitobacter pseudonitzschiae]MBM2299467.1 alpha/beta hydrolase [Pseudosulfitobacter pseudonitzschiae]MBM2304331.1 alpha/beta hydrolase [Pseudosulfitobacter pseudonitzschiae]MBM2314111.1 alpha/beta hydrolase [Pseudosulfitobacter pseudonitzschiae]MBM2319026.1 alpha/beta hydrolase [Pseudosulfitobacter pseudonitzschiae]